MNKRRNKKQTVIDNYPLGLSDLSNHQLDTLLKPCDNKPWAVEMLDEALDDWESFGHCSSIKKRASIRRRIRIWNARVRSCHHKDQWEVILDIFNHKCARCGSECIGGSPCKDHIVPIAYGGSDGVRNLQPLCRECNSGTNSDYDYRPDWLIELLGCDIYGEYINIEVLQW